MFLTHLAPSPFLALKHHNKPGEDGHTNASLVSTGTLWAEKPTRDGAMLERLPVGRWLHTPEKEKNLDQGKEHKKSLTLALNLNRRGYSGDSSAGSTLL